MSVMSINATSDDMVSVEASRNVKAHQAGTAIYGSIHQQQTPESSMEDRKTYAYGSEVISTHRYSPCSTISSVRRTFCLVALFDLCFTFILWVIYTQLIGVTPVWKAFTEQLANYTFQHSLFDTVMMAAVRFALIELAYALFRLNHWWVICITTSLTCVFLISKVFLFCFSDENGHAQNPLSYILLLTSFVLAWVETWMLDFKVLPTERKILLRGEVRRPNERSALLGNEERNVGISDDDKDRYYSPAGSDDENEHEGFRSMPHSRNHSRQDIEYIARAQETMKILWELLNNEEDWKLEKERDGDIVQSAYIKKLKRKIYKLEVDLDISAQALWEDTINNINESPSWNPTLLEAKTLQVVDEKTDISYNIAAEVAGGLVSARDFINLRHWGEREQTFYIAVNSATFVDMPPQKKYVRGESGPGGMVFKRIEGQPNMCHFIWFLNTNLKGWIPQAAIDQGLSIVLMDYVKNLRQHITDLNNRTIS